MSKETGKSLLERQLELAKNKANSWEEPNLANAALKALASGDLSFEERKEVRITARELAKARAQEYKLRLDLKRIIAKDGKSGKKVFNLDKVAFLLEDEE